MPPRLYSLHQSHKCPIVYTALTAQPPLTPLACLFWLMKSLSDYGLHFQKQKFRPKIAWNLVRRPKMIFWNPGSGTWKVKLVRMSSCKLYFELIRVLYIICSDILSIIAVHPEWHIKAETKWQPFCRHYFKCIFWMKVFECFFFKCHEKCVVMVQVTSHQGGILYPQVVYVGDF